MTPRTEWLVGVAALGLLVAALLRHWRAQRSFRAFSLWAVLLPSAVGVLACGALYVAPAARLPVTVQFGALTALPLACGVLILWLRGRDLEGRLTRPRARVHAVWLGLALGAATLLLGHAEGLTWKNDQTRIVVWDVSRSAERAGVTPMRRDAELRLAERSMRAGDRLGVVEVATRAELAVALHAKGEPAARVQSDLARDATDLEAGLRRALAELPADAAAKVVLVSDGVENHGDVLRAVAPARARGIALDALALDYAPPPDLELHAVRGPARAATMQAFDLRVETSAGGDAAIDAELLIERDGVPWQTRPVKIAGGHDVLQLPIEESEAGMHRYAVEIRGAAGNEIRDNDKKTAFVEVSGARTALVLSGIRPGPSPIEGFLREAGFQVKHAGPSDVLDDVADFSARDLVVLEDVPAALLGDARAKALARAVGEVGTGLLLVGGKHAFGPGGYAGSPIEAVSPVSFDLKKDKNRPPLAEVIVIDYSGSMSATVDGQTKISLANEAAARSAALLSPGDQVGVAHVDTEVKWTVPLGVVTDGRALGPQIRSVDAGGGGIYSKVALQAAYAALRAVPAGTLKHVLLFADGSDAEEIVNCPELAAAANAAQITTSVVSLGRGTDSTMLEVVSARGAGRFYLVEDARTLPEVFSQETVLASRRAYREERITPTIVGDSAFFRGVRGLPDLEGYVVTMTKPGARPSLVGPEDEPIVVDWSRGLGKVGVLTTDLAGLWSTAWLASPDAVRLTTQFAASLARAPTPPGVRLGTTVRRGEIVVEATSPLGGSDGATLVAHVVGPNGSEQDLELDEVARGAFEGVLRPDSAGTHVVTLVRRDQETKDAGGQLLARSAVVLGSSDELAPRPTNRVLLERIAAESSGVMRTTLENLFDGERRYYTTRTDLTVPLLWTLAVLLVAMVTTRRLVLPSRARRALPAVAAPEAATFALARKVKTARAQPIQAVHAPLIAKRQTSAPRTEPAEPVDSGRELTAVERIAQRRRDRH